MPELPEVETYVRELTPLLRGRQVVRVAVNWPRTIAEPTPEQFVQRMVGQRFVEFGRRGKYMLLGLESGDTLVVHLRMTGHLFVQPAASEADKHVHLRMALDDGRWLDYQDARKFGRLWLVADPAPVLGRLGPEPLAEPFPFEAFAQKLSGRKASIKTLLLDQALLAGVGNIYADEALHVAGIHPARPGGDLSTAEIVRLYTAVRDILTLAIDHCGSTLGSSSVTNYLRPTGQPGSYQDEHAVYRRAGKPCLRCGTIIERRVIAQRSAHFCPACQT